MRSFATSLPAFVSFASPGLVWPQSAGAARGVGKKTFGGGKNSVVSGSAAAFTMCTQCQGLWSYTEHCIFRVGAGFMADAGDRSDGPRRRRRPRRPKLFVLRASSEEALRPQHSSAVAQRRVPRRPARAASASLRRFLSRGHVSQARSVARPVCGIQSRRELQGGWAHKSHIQGAGGALPEAHEEGARGLVPVLSMRRFFGGVVLVRVATPRNRPRVPLTSPRHNTRCHPSSWGRWGSDGSIREYEPYKRGRYQGEGSGT